MNHYNEALESEKRALARLIENSFYPPELRRQATTHDDLRHQPEEIAHTAPIDVLPVVPQERDDQPTQSDELDAMLDKLQQNPEMMQKLLRNLLSCAAQASCAASSIMENVTCLLASVLTGIRSC